MLRKTSVLAIAVVLVGITTLSSTVPEAGANDVKRIVYPYMVEERWVPVVAGFEVVPPPLQCDTGLSLDTPATNKLLSTSFQEPTPLQLEDSLTFHPSGWYVSNLWHQTDFAGKGTDLVHDGSGKLYFGHDDTGVFKTSFLRIGGAVAFEVDVPAQPSTPYYVAFNTKWQGEWFEGYDHMWVEVIPEDGVTYILCTLNPEGRGDKSSSDTITAAACSPYRVGPCPSDARGLNLGLFDKVDNTAPHWESRYVQIPPIFNGQHVKVRFTFDSSDGVSNNFMGWMLDDVEITNTVLPNAPSAHPLGIAPPELPL